MGEISLKKKIIGTVIGAIIVAGSIATYSVFLYARDVLVEKEKEIILIEAIQISHEVDHIFDQYSSIVEGFSSDMMIIKSLINGEDIQNKIGTHLHHYNTRSDFSIVSILDNSGEIVASTEDELLGESFAEKGFFVHTLEGEGSCSAVAINEKSGELNNYLTNPIKKEDGEIIGVAVIQLKDEIFKEALRTTNEENGLELMFVNKHGIIIHSDEEGRVAKSLGEIDEEAKASIIEKNHFPGIDIEPIQYQEAQDIINSGIEELKLLDFYDEEDGEEEIMAIKKVENYPFFIVIETEKELHTREAIKIAYILSVLVGLAAASAGILIYFSISYQLSPLDKLHDLVMKAAGGNYEVQMNKVSGSGEIHDLASAFNTLLVNVKKSKDEIEVKVREQTRDINNKRKELENQKAAILNILEDVEAEKENADALAEDLKKFKLAVKHASDHIVITDPEGIILYANKAVEKVTGFSREEVVGKKAGSKELWGGRMKKEIYKNLWDTIKNKKEVFVGEFENKTKKGSIYNAATSIGPVLNKNGEVIFFIGIERDITKEKEIDKAKTEFVSLASHQLRTPLSAINWYTEMLLAGDAGKINKAQKDYLKEVYSGSNRMVDLVNALLNVSRIDLGTFAIDPEEIDLKKISDEIIKELAPKIKEKKMKVEKKYDSRLKKINADPKLMGIVFQNLISNAVKYTPEKGKVEVEIKVKKPNVLIKVSDNGFGIPEKQQSKIFDKLFRADNVREKETDGTGLGLYIVKSIAENSGGKIWFESKENKGSIFYVEIPLTGMKKKEGNKELSANK